MVGGDGGADGDGDGGDAGGGGIVGGNGSGGVVGGWPPVEREVTPSGHSHPLSGALPQQRGWPPLTAVSGHATAWA